MPPVEIMILIERYFIDGGIPLEEDTQPASVSETHMGVMPVAVLHLKDETEVGVYAHLQ